MKAQVRSRSKEAAVGKLDDADRKLVAGQREDHNRLGFSVQLATVRYIGRFLADPLDGVPAEVIDFLAGQLRIADPSCVKRYAQAPADAS